MRAAEKRRPSAPANPEAARAIGRTAERAASESTREPAPDLQRRGADSSTEVRGDSARARVDSVARSNPPQPLAEQPTSVATADVNKNVGPEVQALVAEYERAINSRSLTQVREIYPHIPAEQAMQWRNLLDDRRNARDLRVRINMSDLESTRDTVKARLQGTITFRDYRNVPLTVSYDAVAVLRRDSTGWRFLSISEAFTRTP